MAFAQPIIKSGDENSAQSDVLIYLDNSYSMSNEVAGDVAALDAGVMYINEMLKLFPASTSYRLLTNDFDASSRIAKTRTELSDALTELQYSNSPRSAETVRQRIETLTDKPQSVFWISDFQKSTNTTQNVDFDSTYQVNLVPLSFNATDNVAVDSIWLENPFLVGDEKLQLNVSVRNYGKTAAQDIILKVFMDDIQAATASIDIPANATERATFDLVYQLDGINRCRIAFEEFPVTFDNEFYFTINNSQRINVLEVNATENITPIARVFGNEQLYNFQRVDVGNLDYSLLKQNDLVVINGLQEIDPSLAAALNERLSRYGAILIIPGAQLDLDSYKLISGLQGIKKVDSLNSIELKSPDFKNPFFSNVFEEQNKNMAMPSASKLLDWGSDRTAILSLKNNQPFLSHLGGNRPLYLLASPLNESFTTFYNHALFVPVMYRLALQSASEERRLYYFTDQPIITLKTDTLTADNVFKLKRGEEELIPSQRINANQVIMELPNDVLEAGFYDLRLNDKTINTLAFNRSFEESNLTQISRDELQRKFQGRVSIFDTPDQSAFAKELKNKYVGRPLWKYALVLALLFLLVEILLIRFFP